MDVHVFQIDEMRFVTGLFWQPIAADSQADRAKEIRTLASELSFDLHVVRKTTTHCVGFAAARDDIQPGVLAAAAIVSKTLEVQSETQNFIFASRLPDGHWLYVIQRDGIILPDGDQWFQTESDARNRFAEDYGLGDWAGVYAPAVWGYVDSKDVDFVDLLPGDAQGRHELHQWWRLAPVDNSAAYVGYAIKAVAALAVMAIAYGGWTYYQQWRAAQAAKLIVQQAQIEQQQVVKAVPPPHPWKDLPLPHDFVAGCLAAIERVKLFPGNWTLKTANCSAGSLIVSWTPGNHAWIEHLKNVEPKAVISIEGTLATVTIPITMGSARSDEPVRPVQDRIVALRHVTERYGGQLQAQLNTAPQPPAMPGQEGGIVLPPDWQELKVTVSDVLLLDAVTKGLSGPGFRINAIVGTWSNGKLTWKIEGTQYVQN